MNKTKNEILTETVAFVAIDLRRILRDAREELDRFEEYVKSWDNAVTEAQLAGADEARLALLTENYVIDEALKQIDEVAHTHSGGTAAMHMRQARTRLLQLHKLNDNN